MKRLVLLVLLLSVAFDPTVEARAATRNLSAWESSIVNVEVARKQYDYALPWVRRTRRQSKVGTVIGPKQILTSADDIFDRTFVRLQKFGKGAWYAATVTWVDYYANLALITTADEEFWRDLKPVAFGNLRPEEDSLQILRWREGNLESRRAEFSQFAIREGQLTPINVIALEATSDITGAGWGEPIVADGKFVALLWGQDGRACTAVPASFVQSILKAQSAGTFKGLGYFHFYWQVSANPASLAFLQETGPARGVIVSEVPDRPDGQPEVLKARDIILQVEEFAIGIEGDYQDPEFGTLNLEALATRGKWAGDPVKMRVLRDGKKIEVTYTLPKYSLSNDLVPRAEFDHEPDYLIIGGLVFQPLTDSYLMVWGNEWKRRAPFRLQYFNAQPRTKDRPALVVLSEILPDPYNIGYQDYKNLVLDKVNGRPVSYLSDLKEALSQPTDGRHILEFVQSDSLRRMVVYAGANQKEATTRVLKRYGIQEELHITPLPTR